VSVVTSYEPGSPCWAEVSTPDVDRTLRFYCRLFGWRPAPRTTESAWSGYTMLQMDGIDVAGLVNVPAESGLQPTWSTYFASANVDATAEKIARFGGRIAIEPRDVPDAGRSCFGIDPTGALFGVWQAGRHIGAGLVEEPVSLAWSELATSDARAAATFYEAVFGWTGAPLGDDPGAPYRVMDAGGRSCGIWQGDGEARWSAYFAVRDPDATAARALELGGNVDREPVDTPYGRTAMLEDPLGAVFSVVYVAEESVA
jgi:hypothetical protein